MKKYITGDYMEIEMFNLSPCKRPVQRAAKRKESTPAQKKLNNKRRLRYFVRLVNSNFGRKDLAVELTFDEEHLPADKEGVLRELKNYIKRLKRAWKKSGRDPGEFKYIYVISDSAGDGSGESVRLHVHMFVSGMDRDLLEDKWHNGYVNADRLQLNEYGATGKALYYARQGKGERSWGSSTNLIKPEPIVSDRAISKSQMERIINDPSDGRYIEKLFNGKTHKWTFTDCLVELDGRELFGSDIDTGEGMGKSLLIRMRKESWMN